jgi:acyl transferase domain-containing protein/NAD(P)H-dependent flavin oxidoreductase YrpB (nitropropane dioxygenase family)
MSRAFEFAVVAPPLWPDPALAIAGSRAGALGIVDLELSTEPRRAAGLVRRLASLPRLTFGLRLDGARPELAAHLLAGAPPNVSTVILTATAETALTHLVDAVRRERRRVFLSVTSPDEAALADALDVDAVIAKGHEAGGFVGEETSFVLLQRLLAGARRPVWAHGGIGPHTVAACRAAGAAGVVLESQLLLLSESALPEAVHDAVGRMDGSETICVGGELGAQVRVFARPRLRAVEELQQVQRSLQSEDRSRAETAATWRAAVRQRLGWTGATKAWPLGQDAAFAQAFAQRYGTVAGTLEALRDAIATHCRAAEARRPLDERGPLARSHGVRYPILQGPMTRVSDTAAFAERVAEGGGLPFLALALMRRAEVRALLEETRRRLADRPWGVGILGFVPLDLRQEQLEEVLAVRPPVALIAGGRPDQALSLEEQGISTYLHVPSPGLLGMFLQSGAKRFVFEGRECGGHVGPRSSFVLWELMIDVLLSQVPPDADAGAFHVVFAGGIHDARSAAMVSTLAAPLAERGMRVGVLLGTAYLFTTDAVEAGAIVPSFQEVAVGCARTILLETGPGHATRCADTAFGEAFRRERLRLAADPALTPDEVRTALEDLNLGRLRIASKGITRNLEASDPGASRFLQLDAETQRREGMYMIGQVAALRRATCSIAELHRDVSVEGTRRLEGIGALQPEVHAAEVTSHATRRPVPVAIVGMSCVLPKAPNLGRYWENVLGKVDAITEVPPERWDWRRYFDSDPKAADRIYSKWGGFIDPIPFEPIRYGMPPNSLASIEPAQLLTLEVVRAALADAGYAERPFARERTGVVLGVGGGAGDLGQQYAVRANLPMYLDQVPPAVWRQLPEWTEDSFAGILLNVVAGRVANRFDLGGVNYTVDAACASSLAAVYLAVRELQSGTADVMLVGGADTVQNAFGYLCFSKTHALSPRGRCFTFDASADGIVIGEGVAVLVLKRLEDAERDGDRIYAVIRGVAGSSDGRDRGLTAPRPEGQIRALDRAYAESGFPAATVGLFEAHGTGTVAGDQAEILSLTRVLTASGATRASCAVGSVKTMIGHTKCTAGVAGLAKIALALHHRVLPPTMNVERPNPKAFAEDSPLYVNTECRPWVGRPDGVPRRAAASSFGFGGTNFHVVVEEYEPAVPMAAVSHWPSELFVWRAPGREALASALEALEREFLGGATPTLRDLAYSLWEEAKERRAADGAERLPALAIVAGSLDELRRKIRDVRERLAGGQASFGDLRSGYFTETPLGPDGGVAFLFPGQGSQHVDMLRDLAVHFAEVRDAFSRANQVLASRFPAPLGSYVYPPPRFGDAAERAAQDALTRTNVAQAALGAAGHGLLTLLAALGVEPALVAGHSYGEYVALCAAGVFDDATLYELSEARGRAILDAGSADLGTMAAVVADRERTTGLLGGLEGVWVANLNAPTQTMISGTSAAIEEALRRCEAAGVSARRIQVACGFHSPLVAPARDTLAVRLKQVAMRAPRIPVFANSTARPYPDTPDAIVANLADHLVSPVRFADEIEGLYGAGARIFVEVGPGSVLTGLVPQTLEGRPHLAVAVAPRGGSGLASLQAALGQLLAHGEPVDLDRLFEGRAPRRLDLANLADSAREAPLPPGTWLVHGGRVWPASEPDPGPADPVALAPAAQSERTAAPPPHQPAHVLEPASGAPPALATVAGRDHGDVSVADTMAGFQRLMGRFLETQRGVMLAYLRGAPAAPPASSAASPPARAITASAAAEPVPVSSRSTAPEPTIAPPPSAPGPGPVPAEPTTAREALTRTLLALVSERTGYPTEMLGLDVNIEADLGIDSIKRVEILGAFQRAHVPVGPATSGLMERLTAAKTLGQILDLVVEPSSRHAVDADAPRNVEAGTPATNGSGARTPAALGHSAAPASAGRVEVPRFVLEAVAAPLGDRPPLPVSERPLVLTDDRRGVADTLARRWRERGGRAVLLRHGRTHTRVDPESYEVDLTEPSAIEAVIGHIRRELGPIGGVVHLIPLRARATADALDPGSWREGVAVDIEGLFHLVRACGADIRQAGVGHSGFVVAVTAMGGRFGSVAPPAQFLPTDGGVAGLVKTLALEWPAVRCKSLDVEPAESAAEIAGLVLEEMAATDGQVEVAYRGGRRQALQLRPSPLDTGGAAPLRIDSDWVWLLTGGARGITAETALEIAERYRPTIVLAGRSRLPAEEEDPATAKLAGEALKRELIQRLAKDGRLPTPAAVEAEYGRLVRVREIRHTLRALIAAGARARYEAVDVRESGALARLVESIYAAHGRLDAVIHGAGVIEDKLIEDKGIDSFRRVLHTKVDGALALARHLSPEKTRLLVFFSSVAGRFGNRGQSDYAAANEVLNKLAVYLDARWPGRVVALNWGPWRKTGMVSDEVERQFQERGVQVIDPADGRRVLDQELRLGSKGEREVVLGQGPWDTPLVTGRRTGAPMASRARLALPLLEGATTLAGTGGAVEVLRRLDPDQDLYLSDHQLDGKPVLPAAMAMELMGEVVQAGWPEWQLTGVSSLRVLRGIVLENGPRMMRVLARAQTQSVGTDGFSVDVEISEPEGATGSNYRATVHLGSQLPARDGHRVPQPSGLRPFPMTVEEAYERWLFHGPAFQAITEIEGVNDEWIVATFTPSSPDRCLKHPVGAWLIDPVVVDCSFQLAIAWVRLHYDMTPLPARLGAWTRLGPAHGAPLRCFLRAQASAGGAVLTTQIVLADAENRVVGVLQDMEFSCSRALNRLGGTAVKRRRSDQ